MSQIKLQNISKEWPGVKAVDDVSFEVSEGTFTALLGPSGCGKSTILRMIAGLEEVSSGSIFIGNKDITTVDAAKRGISMVFQSYALFPHLTVEENILFGLKVRRVEAKERSERLKNAADLVGLSALLDRKPANLSGGQRQRVALARTIVSRKPVCLMDEPLSNLDAKLRAEMRDEIRGLQQKLGLTTLYVTHDQTEAMTMADKVILLRDGQIEQSGSPKELYNKPSTIFVAQFIGSPPMNVMDARHFENNDDCNSNKEAIFLGIRPEDIRINGSGTPMKVESVDFLGSETLLHFHHQDERLIAKVPGSCEIKPGEQVMVNWSNSAIHTFYKNETRLE